MRAPSVAISSPIQLKWVGEIHVIHRYGLSLARAASVCAQPKNPFFSSMANLVEEKYRTVTRGMMSFQ
jgi:hypothetical protein